MARQRTHKALRIILSLVLLFIVGISCYAAWLTAHYKSILRERIPAYVVAASDSIYCISFSDISVNVFKKWITLSNVKLWADSTRVTYLWKNGQHAPNTISYVSAPTVELSGIQWDDLLSKKMFYCERLIVHNPTWFMQTEKRHPDPTLIPVKKGHPLITRMQVARFEILNPKVSYHFIGDSNSYYCYLKGGNANLYEWALDDDCKKDTSVFLYAKHGTVLPASFEFRKDGRSYNVANPTIDFISDSNSVTLKDVRLKNMADIDLKTGRHMETYSFTAPSLRFVDINWNRLLAKDILVASHIYAHKPFIDIHYERQYFPEDLDRTGNYPQQLLREFIKTDVRALHVEDATLKYNEPGKDNNEQLFQFDDISGTFNNITNIDSLVARDNTCVVKLEGKFMHKSPVSAVFRLSLADPKGHFSVKGHIENLDGNDVTKQVAAFTIAKVTSFHLSRMDGYIEGDESSAKGNFTMLYDGLKMSLFKFKSDDRKGAHGPLAFLADAFILYPSNPMPGKPVRTTTTQLARNPQNGFIDLIWQNMYLGAEKSAVRNEQFLTMAGNDKEEKDAVKQDEGDGKPHKNGFFHKLFHGGLFAHKNK